MATIRELRDQLQAPRASVDALYGKYVMRRFSIYLTFFFSKTPISPTGVTFLSILAGIAGAVHLFMGQWLAGVLWVNGWYLLDHVDGELSRLRKSSSLTGFYLDTLANAIVPPLALAGVGGGMHSFTGETGWVYVGMAAAYASLMLLILPYGASAVTMHWMRAQKDAQPISFSPQKAAVRSGLFRRAFAALHFSILFPVFLPVWTLGVLVSSAVGISADDWMRGTLYFYALTANTVWVAILTHSIFSKKLESQAVELPE